MKNKKLVGLLVSILALAGCNNGKTSDSSSVKPSEDPTTTPSSEVSVSSEASVSSEISVSDSSTTSETPTPTITHQDPFVSELAAGAVTRTFKESFDTMIDDFSGATLNGTNNQGVASANPRLRVLVDSENGDFPSSGDASIYKVGTGNYDIDKYEGIGFKIRKVGEGTLDLSNLVLGLRGGDAWKLYEINLAEAVNPDGEALSELTDEWQDLVISPNLSIENDAEEYEMLGSTEKSGVKVLDEILGLHLYARGECSQVVEIENVFLTNAGEKTVIDSFNRDRVNKADDTCWWRDSTGFIVRKNVMLTNDASYTTAASEAIKENANLVLTVMGDTTGTKITPITASGELATVAWTDLKDSENNPVVNAVNGSFNSLVINFENSNINVADVVSFKIASTSEVYVSEIFVSNLLDKVAVTEYPRVDAANASMFDNFNRTQSGFNGDYDASASNQLVIDAGLYYALSYNNGDKVSIADGHLTFDATDLAAGDYINFKEGKGAYSGQQYLVLAVKTEDGATLNDFRFNVGNGVVYANQMVSATGLALPSLDDATYPYTTEDGYKWLIVDLKESNMEPADYIDFYYSGTGKLLVDCVFYADAFHNYVTTEAVDATIADISGYQYVGGFDANGKELLKVTFKSNTEGQTLKSIRLSSANGEHWFKDGKIVDAKGNVISGDLEVTAEGVTVVIDLQASEMATTDWIHIHSGGYDGVAGDISVVAVAMAEEKYIATEAVDATIADISGYQYVGGFDANGKELLKVTFKSNTEGQTLKSIRLSSANGEHWFKDGKVVDAEGNVISGDLEVTAEGVTVVIDLQASEMATTDRIHIHSGGYDGVAGDISVVAEALAEKSYSDIMSDLQQ